MAMFTKVTPVAHVFVLLARLRVIVTQ